MKLPNSQSTPKTPRQLWVAAVLSFLVAAIVISLGFLALPSLAPEHQAFWSGLIGSFVGSAVAFGGAAWLWRLERHILVEERASDRILVRKDEERRGDLRTLRDCLAVVGNLQALNYNTLGEGRYTTSREKFLMRIKFSEAVSLIHSKSLRDELEFMSQLVDDGDALDYMVMHEYSRLKTVHAWLLRLIALRDDELFDAVRPDNYDRLRSRLAEFDEYQKEQWELQAEYEEQKRQVEKARQERTEA